MYIAWLKNRLTLSNVALTIQDAWKKNSVREMSNTYQDTINPMDQFHLGQRNGLFLMNVNWIKNHRKYKD